jgi:hypothetical protein
MADLSECEQGRTAGIALMVIRQKSRGCPTKANVKIIESLPNPVNDVGCSDKVGWSCRIREDADLPRRKRINEELAFRSN